DVVGRELERVPLEHHAAEREGQPAGEQAPERACASPRPEPDELRDQQRDGGEEEAEPDVEHPAPSLLRAAALRLRGAATHRQLRALHAPQLPRVGDRGADVHAPSAFASAFAGAGSGSAITAQKISSRLSGSTRSSGCDWRSCSASAGENPVLITAT